MEESRDADSEKKKETFKEKVKRMEEEDRLSRSQSQLPNSDLPNPIPEYPAIPKPEPPKKRWFDIPFYPPPKPKTWQNKACS